MAKKSRRSRKKSSRNVSRGAVEGQTASTAPAPAPAPAPADAAAVPDRQEYAYVVADLKRVAILASGVFALLIGLSLFIR